MGACPFNNITLLDFMRIAIKSINALTNGWRRNISIKFINSH